jgi:hypothetical protein
MEYPRFFSTWRTQSLAGTREVVDAVVRAEHIGPSEELCAELASWPGAWYWADDSRDRVVLIRGTAPVRPIRWLWHGGLFLMTVLTTLAAGAVLANSWVPPAAAGLGGAVSGVMDFLSTLFNGGLAQLLPGWTFAVPLLAILLVHEFGHYLTARRYAMDVSPPYFLPVPPHLSPIGNLGAFLRIRSAVYDRRQLLEVGAAGPLAGFVVAVAVLWWGLRSSSPLPTELPSSVSMVILSGQPVVLGDSLLIGWLRGVVLPDAGALLLSPMAFAGWVGMFITSLNLLPLSQLDGGHVLYGLAGRRQTMISAVAVVALLWLGRDTPMWWIWVALTFVIGGGKWSHADVVLPDRGIPRRTSLIGWACVVVFVVTFVPVPFS